MGIKHSPFGREFVLIVCFVQKLFEKFTFPNRIWRIFFVAIWQLMYDLALKINDLRRLLFSWIFYLWCYLSMDWGQKTRRMEGGWIARISPFVCCFYFDLWFIGRLFYDWVRRIRYDVRILYNFYVFCYDVQFRISKREKEYSIPHCKLNNVSRSLHYSEDDLVPFLIL